jgi:pimeloyl-ACP methyl ester carboxylesterase
MTLRRYAPLALAALAVACQPKLESRDNPAYIDFVAFDLSKEIDGVNTIMPQPSDVSLANAATLPVSAQRELLEEFVAAGGFPSDQEVPITIDFSRQLIQGKADRKIFTGTTLDTASVIGGLNVAIFQYAQGGTPLAAPVLVPFDAAATTFTAGTGRGTLALHRTKDAATGSRAWKADAQYVVFVRGGASGVKVTGGGEIHAWPTMRVILDAAATGKSLLDPANQGLLPGTPEEKTAAAARLEPLRAGFAALMPIALNPAGLNWPAAEIVSMQTFDVAPSHGTVVTVDSGSGIAPLPFDLMREAIPSDTTKPLDAGLVKPNPAFGAAGAGLVTLDGFSTTAMILAQTSGPITAASVPGNVKLFKRSCTGAPSVCTWSEVVAVVKQPPQIQQGGFSVAIGIQPAVWTGSVALPPLAENTKYAVVVTDGVTDFTGTTSLARSTVAKILLEMTQPVVAPWPVAQGTNPSTLTPLLAGMDGQTAAGIQKMRDELDELIGTTSLGLNRSTIKAAYTFKTQTVTPTSVGLAAAPYAGLTAVAPSNVTAFTPAEFQTATAIPSALFPSGSTIVTAKITTIDPMDTDPSKGTLNPNQGAWGTKQLDAIVVVPAAASVTASCPAPASALKCAPLVVFHHGLAGSRLQAVVLANALAGSGFAVAAIDAPFHGARAFCSTDAQCASGGTCTLNMVDPDGAGPIPAFQNQIVPSSCSTSLAPDSTGLSTAASGNYLISANFFRFRDALREDVLDQSALVLALAPPTPRATDAFATAVTGTGVAIDPTKVYFLGQSLGGIVGTQILATTPRYSRGVLNVPGGTVVDVFSTSPTFTTGSNDATPDSPLELALQAVIPGFDLAKVDPSHPGFTPAGLDAAMAAAYLKTLNVAKWIIDPADPINYAANVETKLPSPLMVSLPAGVLSYATTAAFGQVAKGDTVIPNATNYELLTLAGVPWAQYETSGGGSVPHGYLLSGPPLNLMQTDAVTFLLDGTTVPTSPVVVP